MKTLETEFIKNVDSCGDHRFTQLKRKGDIALYQRAKLTGKIIGFEIFRVKIVKEGTSLPGGGIVAEDYEVYPSKHAFGKTAAYITANGATNISEEIFEKLAKKFTSASEVEEEEEELVIPSEPFSIKNIVDLNPSKNYIACYQYIKSELDKTIELFEIRPTESGRGKPTNFYRKIT